MVRLEDPQDKVLGHWGILRPERCKQLRVAIDAQVHIGEAVLANDEQCRGGDCLEFASGIVLRLNCREKPPNVSPYSLLSPRNHGFGCDPSSN